MVGAWSSPCLYLLRQWPSLIHIETQVLMVLLVVLAAELSHGNSVVGHVHTLVHHIGMQVNNKVI